MQHWAFLEDLPRPGDFKPEDELAKETHSVAGIYLLRNRNGDIVYVGQSSAIQTRLRQHRKDRSKDWAAAEYYPLDGEMSRLQVEGILILALLPRHNRALALGLAPGKIWELAYTFRNARAKRS